MRDDRTAPSSAHRGEKSQRVGDLGKMSLAGHASFFSLAVSYF
jgi:hypothetical protein